MTIDVCLTFILVVHEASVHSSIHFHDNYTYAEEAPNILVCCHILVVMFMKLTDELPL